MMEIIPAVAETEFRALDMRVVVPPPTFGMQYASITESKSESPSLVSTRLNVQQKDRI